MSKDQKNTIAGVKLFGTTMLDGNATELKGIAIVKQPIQNMSGCGNDPCSNQGDQPGELSPLNQEERELLRKQENIIRKSGRRFMTRSRALNTILKRKLYREEYTTFHEYCLQRFYIKREMADYQVHAAEVAIELRSQASNSRLILPETEEDMNTILALKSNEERLDAILIANRMARRGRPLGFMYDEAVQQARSRWLAADSSIRRLANIWIEKYEPLSLCHMGKASSCKVKVTGSMLLKEVKVLRENLREELHSQRTNQSCIIHVCIVLDMLRAYLEQQTLTTQGGTGNISPRANEPEGKSPFPQNIQVKVIDQEYYRVDESRSAYCSGCGNFHRNCSCLSM